MNCHFTRAKLLSIQISRKYTRSTMTMATRTETGFAHRKNMPIQPRKSTFSHQCMISTMPSVGPLISVVMPRTISWWA